MHYLRLGCVAILLLAMTYVLYQCGDTSALETVKPTAPANPEAPKPAVVVAPAAPVNPNAPVPGKAALADLQRQSDLNALFRQTIPLLEAHDLEAVVKTTMGPVEIQDYMQSGHLNSQDEIASWLRQHTLHLDDHLSNLLIAMRQVQGQTPEMSADGTRATYKVDPPAGDRKDLVFVKVDGYWYIR